MSWKKIDIESISDYTGAYPVKVGLLSFDVFGYPRSREINDLAEWLKGIKPSPNKVVVEFDTLDGAYEYLFKQAVWDGIIWEKFETGPDAVTVVTLPIKDGIGFQGPYKMILIN